jgi:SAM-dependent methyltransferase
MRAIHGWSLFSISLVHGLLGCPTVDGAGRAPTDPPQGVMHAGRPDGEPVHEGIGPSGPLPHRNHHAHDRKNARFEDAARWSLTFDAPERDAWQRPDEVVAAALGDLGREGLVVADIGAGTGYFALRFARALPAGQVVAVDIEASLLQWIEERAVAEGIRNLRTHRSNPEGLDWVPALGRPGLLFLCNTYHHVEGRVPWFRALLDIAASDARLVIVDFRPDSPRGPPRHHKLDAAVVIAELAEAGWKLRGSSDFLPDQYLLTFERAP